MIEAKVQCKLGCHLYQKPRPRGSDYPSGGVFELCNLSDSAVEITWQCNPLQYLDLLVLDASKTSITNTYYGSLFSPNAKFFVLRLEPGASVSYSVDLLGNVPRTKLQAGTYTIQAVYDYKDMIATSDPIQITLSEEDAKRLRYPYE